MVVAEVIMGMIFLVASGVGAYVVNFFRSKKKEVDDNTKDIECLKKALIMVAKRIDRGTEKSHPEIDSHLEDLVRDLLTDDIIDNE